MACKSNKPKTLPSQEELNELFAYEPKTGKLFWKPRSLAWFTDEPHSRSWNKRNAGKEAFTAKDSHGYHHGTVNGVSFRAHRVIWAMHSSEPFDQIDHVNGVRTDNRLENLRPADDASNRKNQKRPKDNTSGHIGICWNKNASKWMAEIKSGGVREYLGLFVELADAVKAREEAQVRHGFHPNHGRA